MCQLEARDTERALGPVLASLGASLVVISHQISGLRELQEKYFEGPVYLDSSKAFFTALGDRMALKTDIALPEVKAAGKAAFVALKAEDPSYKLSSEGEGALLGGSIVFAGKSGAVLLMHREKVFGDVAQPAALLECIRQSAASI